VKAAKETSQQELYTHGRHYYSSTVVLTAAGARCRQVCRDHARILAESVKRLRETRQFIDRRQRRIKNALRKHTHPSVGLVQPGPGAEIWPAAKPKKKTNVASGAARRDIPCLTTQEVGLGGKKARRSND
jgi:hypothetical protein